MPGFFNVRATGTAFCALRRNNLSTAQNRLIWGFEKVFLLLRLYYSRKNNMGK